LVGTGRAVGDEPRGPGYVNSVREFGARGDGQTDDTEAFQRAIDAAGEAGGGRVHVPAGRYLIGGHLTVPQAVTLEGTFDAPARTLDTFGRMEREPGSILLATAGKGEEDGQPFITLLLNAHLRGLIVYYPEQEVPPVPYPWTVRGIGDNVSITNVLLINPYQAVDFGTHPVGRHYINGLYAQALKTGLFIDQCFDVGRVENVHFWPFWRAEEDLREWMQANATAFIIGRTDWQYMTNCFTIWYNVGFQFIANEQHGPGNAVLTQCGADVGPVAVKVDAVQRHAGVSFSNSQFMAGIEVGPENQGPVKFTSSGFWGWGETDEHVRIRGGGHVTFTACHFTAWGQTRPDAYAIVAESGGLTVNGCEFLDEGEDKRHILLEEDVEAAVVVGNRFRSEMRIENNAEGEVAIADNVTSRGPELERAMESGDVGRVAELMERRLSRRPMAEQPHGLRLAAAQVLRGDAHREVRMRLLRSLAEEREEDALRQTFVRRAEDELRLEAGESPRRGVIVAKRAGRAPAMDDVAGDLWSEAEEMVFPEGSSPQTAVRMLWDDVALYVSFRMDEPQMDRLRAEETQRDGRVWTDDSVELFLSPGGMTHRYLQMIVNAAGVLYDGTGTMRETSARTWDSDAEVRAWKEEGRWKVAIRLSWEDIGHAAPSPGEVWGVDFRRWRHVTGRTEYHVWSGAPRGGSTHNAQAFGYVQFE
jgi:hypothetical protein